MAVSPVERLGSLDELLDLALAEHDRQVQHFESLDGKAGVLLGFAGLLVGIAPQVPTLARMIGASAAALAGIFAVMALWPRRFEVLDMVAVRQEALDLPSVQTRRLLTDTHVAAWLHNRKRLNSKAVRLRLGLLTLLMGILVYAGGILGLTGGAA